MKKFVKIRSPSVVSEGEGERALLPVCYNDSTAVRAHEGLALVFVDKDLAPRIYARKPCPSACEHPPACYLVSDRVFTPAGAATKSC